MIWLYLQIIGSAVERLLKEEDLWSFDRSDLENAAMFLILTNASNRDESALQIRELISKHFSSDHDLAEWSKDTCEKVNFEVQRYSTVEFQLTYPISSLLNTSRKDALTLL